MLTIQLVPIINAHQPVKLAAYKAARSLIVNSKNKDPEDALETMRKAALLSLTDISPSISYKEGIAFKGKKVLSHEAKTFLLPIAAISRTSPLKLGGKYLYALFHTEVKLSEPESVFYIERGSCLKVEVKYRYRLSIPIAKEIIHRIMPKDPTEHPLGYITIHKSVKMQSES
jgi:hypothetical protein